MGCGDRRKTHGRCPSVWAPVQAPEGARYALRGRFCPEPLRLRLVCRQFNSLRSPGAMTTETLLLSSQHVPTDAVSWPVIASLVLGAIGTVSGVLGSILGVLNYRAQRQRDKLG